MPRSFKNQLTGQIGEALVVAELGRRGVIATAFAGNVPDVDVLAYVNGLTFALQVKSWRAGGLHTDASRFAKIEWLGDRQIIKGRVELADDNLIYVYVKIGENHQLDEFYLIRQKDLQDIVIRNHQAWLDKHDGVRPKNPKSTHVTVKKTDLDPYKDNWEILSDGREGYFDSH